VNFETPGQAARDARQHAILDGADEKTAMDHAAKAAIDWQRAEDATPTAEDFDHAADVISGRAATPGQAALQPVDSVYLYHWRFDRGEEFGLYRRKADAEAAAEARAAEHPGEGLFEVLGMAVLDRPQPQPAPEPSRTEWVVFWGGENPDDCAGWDSRDDEADAEELREWIVGGGVACRPVMYGPWTVTVPPPPADRGLLGDWSDEELAEFRRWREQQKEAGQ
jgi:hypothetical protein